MANDIVKAVSSNDIHNGSVIVRQAGSPYYQLGNSSNPDFTDPSITDIQSKYDTSFDDPNYYGGSSSSNTFTGSGDVSLDNLSVNGMLVVGSGSSFDGNITGFIQSPVLFYNPHDVDSSYYGFMAGTTGSVKRYLAWYDYDATDVNDKKWLLGVNRQNSFILFDTDSSAHIMFVYQSGEINGSAANSTELNSKRSAAVRINYHGEPSATLGSGGLEVYNGGASPKLIMKAANNELQIRDQSTMASGVGGELELWGRLYTDIATPLFPFARIKAKKENSTDASSLTTLAFSTTTSAGSPTEKMWLNSQGRLGIGNTGAIGSVFEFTPQRSIHVIGNDYTSHIRVQNAKPTGAWSSIRTEMPGFEIVTADLNAGNQYGGIKWYTTDASLTTTNPKLTAGISARATQTLDGDTKGGTSIDIGITDDTAGTTNAVKTIFSIDGSAGSGVTNRARGIRLFDSDDGSTNAYIGGWRFGYRTTEGSLTGAGITIQANVPSGAKLVGTLLRVDSEIGATTGTAWSASYTGGNTQSIASGLAFAKNTKANRLFDPYIQSPITSGETDISILVNSGIFLSGIVHTQVFYEYLENLGNAP